MKHWYLGRTRLFARSALFAALISAPALAARVNRNVVAEEVEWFVTTIPQGATQQFTLSGAGASDAAIHLFDATTLAPLQSAKGATLTYANAGSLKNVGVLIHSTKSGVEGTLRLEAFRNGTRVFSFDVRLGGNLTQVPCGSTAVPLDYETAPRPGVTTDTVLVGFDNNLKAVAFDDDSGVHREARLTAQTKVCQVLVAHTDASPAAAVDLYVNDPTNDRDGDGLGSLLEKELKTCDASSDAGCSQVFNLRDTDRDGLEDTLELFGLDSDPPLLLPAWGADPRQKDLFLEVDAHPHDAIALEVDDLRTIARLYAEGPSDQLRNPNGKAGVRVHFDVGQAPTDPADQTLFGDWGGSNALSEDLCEEASATCYRDEGHSKDMAKHRRGIFYYGISNPSGGGQAAGGRGRFHAGPNPFNFAHELGHAIGLGHGGINSENCKPHYPSLMNYATLYGGDVGFFAGKNVAPMSRYYAQELDPFGLTSASPPTVLTTTHLAIDAWMLGGDGLNADWNRSGTMSGVWRMSVQEAVTEGSGGGCGIGAKDVDLASQRESLGKLGSPSITRLGNFFASDGEGFGSLVFWVNGAGKVKFRGLRDDGALDAGGCIDGCEAARSEGEVSGISNALGVSAAQFMIRRPNTVPVPALGLALRDDQDRVKVAISKNLNYSAQHGYRLAQEVNPATAWQFVDLGVTSSTTPEIVDMTVNTGNSIRSSLAVIYVDKATTEFHWVVLNGEDPAIAANWLKKGKLLDKNRNALLASKAGDDGVIGRFKPNVTTVTFDQWLRAVGTFASGDGNGWVYAYIAERDQWERRVVLGAVLNEPSIAIGHERVGSALVNGEPPTARSAANPERGRVYVSYKRERGNDQFPALYMSKFFALRELFTVDQPLASDRVIGITNIWGRTTGSAPVDLYQDLYTGSLRGVRLVTEGSGEEKTRKIQLLPWVDGTRPGTMEVRSDFEFMERNLCIGVRHIKGDKVEYCGTDEDSVSGL